MYKKSLIELLSLLDSREISATELTTHYLERIQSLDKKLNGFITVTAEKALEQAKQADLDRANGNAAPLAGIPIAHKDIFCTKGIKTTCASQMLDTFIAPYDAHVVSKLATAGCVMLGKTNMDEFAMGSSNENSYYGPCKNPWNTNYTPGGSSGGSAAVVAARLTPIATGTDTGGSIRQPAALCGITGLKPTYSRVSRYGMIAFASSLDQGGLMATSAADIACMLPHMSGHDPRDSTCSTEPVPNYTEELQQPLTGMRIGLPEQYFTDDLDTEMRKILDDTQAVLQDLGATFVPVSLKHTHLASSAYYILAPAECSSNLARFDGVRYGHRTKDYNSLREMYEKSRSEGFGTEVKRRILTGTYVLSAGYYDAYYRKAQQVRRLIRQDFLDAFEKVDCLLTPTTPTPAFKLGEKKDNPIEMYLSDIYTIAVNLAGLPGLSMPAGFIKQMPVGAQLIGPHFAEGKLLQVAHQYQQQTDWHLRIPDLACENQNVSS